MVSYLDQPLFQALQFHEVIDAVPGLKRVDLLIAGAVPDENNFFARFNAIHSARGRGALAPLVPLFIIVGPR